MASWTGHMPTKDSQSLSDADQIVKLEREIKLLRQALGQSDRVRKQWLGAFNELKQTRKALSASEEMLRDILNTIPVSVFWKDENLRFVGCNERFAQDAGVTPEEIIGATSTLENWHQLDQQVLESGQAVLDMEERRRRPDGSSFWIRSNRIPLHDENGKVHGVLGCYENIDTRKNIELELKKSQTRLEEKVVARTKELLRANRALEQEVEERKQINSSLRKFSSAVEQSGSMVMITDSNGIIQYTNPQFTETTGYESAEAIGKSPSLLNSGRTPQDIYNDLWSTILDGRHWRGQLHNKKKNGDFYWSYLSISPIADEQGEITHFVAVSEDVTELKTTQQKMEQLALFDVLTNLPNRRLFKDRLEKALAHSLREKNKLGMIFIDLDNFKQINDTLGHDTGDRLLMSVSKRLISNLRIEDTVARLGGDEFTIVLSDLHSAADARHIALKLLDTVRQPFIIDGQEISISCSLGITIAPDDATDCSSLMKNADMAMYKAKESGRNTLRFFTESMNHEISRRVSIEKELKQAIQDNQFELYFQPQIDLRTGTISGAEALIRWHHPEKGLISPAEFIPIAEDTGSIIPIGEWVIEQACNVAKTINQGRLSEICISVNLSAQQFRDPALPRKVAHIINAIGLDSRLLEFEITETVLMENTRVASAILDGLKNLGVSLAIDDFGTGYSSLNYLKRFPVDVLKVDRSFVMDIPQDSNDMAITAAVLAMAQQLKISVIAEGIESDLQLDFLRQHGCEFGQGYLFSKPLPLTQLESYIQTAHPEHIRR